MQSIIPKIHIHNTYITVHDDEKYLCISELTDRVLKANCDPCTLIEQSVKNEFGQTKKFAYCERLWWSDNMHAILVSMCVH